MSELGNPCRVCGNPAQYVVALCEDDMQRPIPHPLASYLDVTDAAMEAAIHAEYNRQVPTGSRDARIVGEGVRLRVRHE